MLLSAGSLVPADAVILEATDCFVSEAVLTGESFPVEKRARHCWPSHPALAETHELRLPRHQRAQRHGALPGRQDRRATEFGAIAHRLTLRPPETEFDRGIRRFGYLLTSAMLIMVLLVFVAHMFRGRPPVETLLFSVALAVGLSPELLPAILSVNLARGAQMMARHGVLVRRLNAIENLGSMDVLCTDKTGTLTEGVVQLEGRYDPPARRRRRSSSSAPAMPRSRPASPARSTTRSWPRDSRISTASRKLAEIPFDFVRKRVTVVVEASGGHPPHHQGRVPPRARDLHASADGSALDDAARAQLEQRYDAWSAAAASACSPSPRDASPPRRPMAARTSGT